MRSSDLDFHLRPTGLGSNRHKIHTFPGCPSESFCQPNPGMEMYCTEWFLLQWVLGSPVLRTQVEALKWDLSSQLREKRNTDKAPQVRPGGVRRAQCHSLEVHFNCAILKASFLE